MDALIRQLAALRADRYRGTARLTPSDQAGPEEILLLEELNELLAEARTQRTRNGRFRSTLLTDIDAISSTLGQIAVGNFDAPVCDLQRPEMDTLCLGVKDMAARLARFRDELEGKINELRASEARVRKEREVAEAATRTKSEFLANMSHEIRTPLNAIIGLSELALLGNPEDRRTGYLRKIRNAGKVLLSVINDILDFSKIEAGKLTVEEAPFDLRDVLDGVADMFSPVVAEKGLELVFSAAPDVPPYLVGDAMRLGQVLINLVSNAVKFTEEGEVVVTVELDALRDEEVQLHFAVRDTGMGIPEEKLGQLFESFTQADSSTTRKFGGTGLGLAICLRLVELMGGHFDVHSTPGRGSTFSFSIVLRLGRPEEDLETRVPEGMRGRRVLVVDDNATARTFVSELLRSFSLEPVTVNNGAEAVKELQRGLKGAPYDLVLMDWRMPVMDGIEATRRIREEKDLAETPVVMLTAYGGEEVFSGARQAGVHSFLLKPVKQSQLFNAIYEALGQGSLDPEKTNRNRFDRSDAFRSCKGARVLLVEDNAINQQVARETLETAGVVVTVTADGVQAFEALCREAFDAVLMDVQMPVLDGYAATKAIRAGELQLPENHRWLTLPEARRRVPIVAMTAHALAGDRERCIDAGMDDYLQKPIDANRLFATLSRWVGNVDVTDVEPSVELPPLLDEEALLPTVPGLDLRAARNRVAGNDALLWKLLTEFKRDYARLPEHLREVLAQDDRTTAHRTAHTVKGMALVFGAVELAEAAARLEAALADREQESPDPDPLVDQLAQALATVLTGVDMALDAAREPTRETTAAPDAEEAEELAPLVGELDYLLRRSNFKATSVAQEVHRALTNSPCRDEATQLKERIEQFDFAGARSALANLAANLELTHLLEQTGGGD